MMVALIIKTIFKTVYIHISVLILALSPIYCNDLNKCEHLEIPKNGYFIGGVCTNDLENACAFGCNLGYRMVGSKIRICSRHKDQAINDTTIDQYPEWSGEPTRCEIKHCEPLTPSPNLIIHCSNNNFEYGTVCYQTCENGLRNVGSPYRLCTGIQEWSGVRGKCINSTLGPNNIMKNETKPESNSIILSDLTNYSIILDNNFYHTFSSEITSLPITTSMWIRSFSTPQLLIWKYNYNCQRIALNTDSESRFQFIKNDKIYFKSDMYLVERQWTQLVLAINETSISFYVNGIFDMTVNLTNYDNNRLCVRKENSKSASSDSKINVYLRPKYRRRKRMAVNELTRLYVISTLLVDEEVLEDHYSCDLLDINKEHLLLDWSNYNITLNKTNFLQSRFCKDCSAPQTFFNSTVSYTGLSTGDTSLYVCDDNMILRGFQTSVCMVYGEWSHLPPTCEYSNKIQKFVKKNW